MFWHNLTGLNPLFIIYYFATMTFLPDGYTVPKQNGSAYFKPQEAQTRIRILSSPITGYIDWDKSGAKPTPVRTKELKAPIWEDTPKHFRALAIYNYDAKAVQVWEITQASVRNAIMALVDGERGDPKEYDIKVWKKGKLMDTEYFVQTTPDGKKELSEEVMKIVNETPCNLEALYDGADPFEATF